MAIQIEDTPCNSVIKRSTRPQIVHGKGIFTDRAATFPNANPCGGMIESPGFLFLALVVIKHFHHAASATDLRGSHRFCIRRVEHRNFYLECVAGGPVWPDACHGEVFFVLNRLKPPFRHLGLCIRFRDMAYREHHRHRELQSVLGASFMGLKTRLMHHLGLACTINELFGA